MFVLHLIAAKTIFKFPIDKRFSLCYNITRCEKDPNTTVIGNLGVAQVVERYLGVVEAVGSSPATQTINKSHIVRLIFLYFFGG